MIHITKQDDSYESDKDARKRLSSQLAATLVELDKARRELSDAQNKASCIALELDAEKSNHKRDNEFLVAELNKLRAAIRSFVTDYERIAWGPDGDCGSQMLVDHLFSQLE